MLVGFPVLTTGWVDTGCMPLLPAPGPPAPAPRQVVQVGHVCNSIVRVVCDMNSMRDRYPDLCGIGARTNLLPTWTEKGFRHQGDAKACTLTHDLAFMIDGGGVHGGTGSGLIGSCLGTSSAPNIAIPAINIIPPAPPSSQDGGSTAGGQGASGARCVHSFMEPATAASNSVCVYIPRVAAATAASTTDCDTSLMSASCTAAADASGGNACSQISVLRQKALQ